MSIVFELYLLLVLLRACSNQTKALLCLETITVYSCGIFKNTASSVIGGKPNPSLIVFVIYDTS